MKRKIEDIQRHYEKTIVRFYNDDKWYFIDLKEFVKDMEIDVDIIKKRTRTWVIKSGTKKEM